MSHVRNSKNFNTTYYALCYGVSPKKLAKVHGWRFVKCVVKEAKRMMTRSAILENRSVVNYTWNPCKTEEVTWYESN